MHSRFFSSPWRTALSRAVVALSCCSALIGPAGAVTSQGWNAALARNFEVTQSQQTPHLRDLTSWKQGQHGNCATVGFAKASNAVWGGRLYSKVEKDGQGGYRILAQNQRSYSLSAGQLKSAVQTADFRGPDNASKAQAIVTVGVLAQCYADTHKVSYQQALDARANNGASAGEFARCLGIPYWETSETTQAVSQLSKARERQAGVVEALFRNQGKLEGHVEAMISRPDGTVVGDYYGRFFRQSIKNPSIRFEDQDIPAGRVALLGQSWQELSPDALRNSLRDQALEFMILKPAPPDLRTQASLALDLLDAPEADLKQIRQNLDDERQQGQNYAGWFGRLGPKLSPETASQMFKSVTLHMAYDSKLPPEHKQIADLLHTVHSSLDPQDELRLAPLLASPPPARADALAAAILSNSPQLSQRASVDLNRATLSMLSRSPQASPSQQELASGIYRDFQVTSEQRPVYYQKLLQALASGSRQQSADIRHDLNSQPPHRVFRP